jgi:hypothetical protein
MFIGQLVTGNESIVRRSERFLLLPRSVWPFWRFAQEAAASWHSLAALSLEPTWSRSTMHVGFWTQADSLP